ncbi:hypothetical protein HRG_014393 [Hirsutella rhossiliensis]
MSSLITSFLAEPPQRSSLRQPLTVRSTNSLGKITLLCYSSQQSIPARNSKSEFGAGRQQRSLEHAQYSKNSVPSLYYVFLCRLSLQTTLIKWAALILVTN